MAGISGYFRQNRFWQWEFWTGETPVDRLDLFRRFFAFSAIVYFAFWFVHWREWLTPEGFHLTPDNRLWYHFRPIAPISPPAVLVAGITLFTCLTAIVAGIKPHWFVWPLLICLGLVHGIDVISAFTLNKYYFVFFLVMALSLARSKGAVSRWPERVIQATLIIQYATAGWCKVFHGDWMEYPDTLWTHAQGSYRTEFAAWCLRTLPKGIWTILMYGSLLYEIVAPLLFLVPKLRKWAFLGGVAFHGGIALMMHQLFFFSFQLVTLYILFLPSSWIEKIRSMLRLPVG